MSILHKVCIFFISPEADFISTSTLSAGAIPFSILSTLINSDPIIIKSNYAKYNKINYETNFEEDVLLTYQTHRITSQNLDLSFENNLATIYNKIVYDNNNVKISADILEIDLITKNSKIFMNNEYKKIKISTNK